MRSILILSLGSFICAPAAASAQPAPVSSAAAVRLDVAHGGGPIRDAVRMAADQIGPADDDWQRQHDKVQAKRRGGRSWMLAGAGVIAAGTLMATQVEPQCSGGICTLDYRLPYVVVSSGAAALGWGIVQFREAGRTLRDLENQRTFASPPAPSAAVPIGAGNVVTIAAGTASVAYTITW